MSPLPELYLQSFPASLFLLQNDVLTFFQEFPQILLLKLALADIQIPHTELPALAIRELSEELGIKASPDDLVPIGTHEGNSHSIFYGKPFHNHEFSTLYLYTKPVQFKDLVLQESEIQSVKWFNLNQLMKDIKNNAPGYCLYYDELQILKAALDNR